MDHNITILTIRKNFIDNLAMRVHVIAYNKNVIRIGHIDGVNIGIYTTPYAKRAAIIGLE